MAGYRILSLDGGGIRGIFTARLLARLEQAVPGYLARFDLFAGTSSGSILALGLVAGLTPAELVALYRDNAADMFEDSWLDNIKDLGRTLGAQYNNRQLKRVLTRVFHARNVVTLDDLGKRVLIPAFDLDDAQDPRRKPNKPRTWKAKFFHNYPGPDSDGAESVVDVAMRASAAPTYFPSYDRFIDGAVVVNNPAMAALAQALHMPTGGQELRNIQLLSVGTGTNPTFIAGKDHDWGYVQWVRPVIDLMMDGGMGVVDYQCAQILDDRYHRLSTYLRQPIPLDGYQQIDQLLRYADAIDITPTIGWIEQHIMCTPRPSAS